MEQGSRFGSLRSCRFFLFAFALAIIFFSTPAKAETLPLTECMTLDNASTTYELQNNISVAPESNYCFNNISNDVYFDCNGFNISSPDEYGIGFYPLGNFTLFNCGNISGFYEAVDIETALNFSVYNSTFTAFGTDDNFYNPGVFGGWDIIKDNYFFGGGCSVTSYQGNIFNNVFSNFNYNALCGGNSSFYNNTILSCSDSALIVSIVGNSSIYDNYFINGECGIISGVHDESAVIYNNVINVTGIYYSNGSIGNGGFFFWNNSVVGNFWAKPDGTGYSQTCADVDNNGICDVPYNVTTDTPCTAGVDCGANVDYLPLSRYPYQPEQGCEESWQCTPWTYNATDCTLRRTCTDINNCGTNRTKPLEEQSTACRCTPNWQCGNWSCPTCSQNGFFQVRTCTDLGNCNTTVSMPSTTRLSNTGYFAMFFVAALALAILAIGLGFDLGFLVIIAGSISILVGGALLIYPSDFPFNTAIALVCVIFGIGLLLVSTATEV